MAGIPPIAIWNTLGKAMNTSDGPASGSSPGTENTAGNITMPAITATLISISPTVKAVLVILASRLKYEAYVHMQPIPRLSE